MPGFPHHPRRLIRAVAAVATALFVMIPAAAQAVSSTSPKVVPPKDYYLALGDSLAFGYQQAKFNSLLPDEDPTRFNTGYVDDFAATLNRISPGLTTENLGCPGETTDSFLGDGLCGYHTRYPLHVAYTGSQIDAAKNFLATHSRQTSPVTLDIGANDLLALINSCKDPVSGTVKADCVSGGFSGMRDHVAGNVASILAALQAVAPTAEYIVMGLYNPFFNVPGLDLLVQTYNAAIKAVAVAAHARFADPFPVINGNEPNSVCSQIAICTPLQDIHPNDNGYQAIASVFFAASGYAR